MENEIPKTTAKDCFNVPNMLSFLRLLLVPVYWLVFFYSRDLVIGQPFLPAFCVFALASFTDVLDGVIARKFNLITQFGKVLDPLADKCMQVSALLTLAISGRLMWIFAVLIFAKEMYMIVCAAILFRRKVVVYSNLVGKTATVVMSIGIVLMFFEQTCAIGGYVTNCGIGISVLAAIYYSYLTIKQLNGKLPSGEEETNIKF